MNAPPNSLMHAFARGDRDLAVPARLDVRRDGGADSVAVVGVLRLLPRKRLVLRADLEGRPVALKWFAADAHGRRHVQRERAGLAAVQAAGLPAPDILEELHTADGAYIGLAYAWVDAAPELGRLWPTFTLAQKQHWLRELVEILARLHASGAQQTDIHLGNFLLRENTLWLLDLGTITTQPQALDIDSSLANLASLAAQLAPAERPLLEDCLPAYLQQRGWSDSPQVRRTYQAALARAWRARYLDYLQKCWRDCSLTRFAQDFFQVCAARRGRWGPELKQFCANPDHTFAAAAVLKAGNTATVVRAVLDGQPMVIKRYNIKNWRHAVSRCWRPSRAAHSWRFAHLLEIAGISSPPPVAVVERRWGWLRGRAWFVCAAVSGENLLALGERGALAPAIFESLRQLLLGLQRERISHGDFKATNFLVSGDAVTLIDLDAMRQHRSTAAFRRAFARDLRRLQRNWDAATPVRVQIDTLVGELLTQQQFS
jgi:tRNA A-37 threonylcarbamoyl transferase component Bud32